MVAFGLLKLTTHTNSHAFMLIYYVVIVNLFWEMYCLSFHNLGPFYILQYFASHGFACSLQKSLQLSLTERKTSQFKPSHCPASDISVFQFVSSSSAWSAVYYMKPIFSLHCNLFSCQRINDSSVMTPVCERLLHSLSPLWSIPKPCSVFIDAVYFVHYQINNKTQPWPEEQKRKVIHTWVESIYIRTMSALSILWVPACIFGIMHLCNIKSKMFIRRGFITGQKEQPVPLMFLERSPSPPPSLFFGLEIGWEPTHIFSKCLHDRNRLGRRLNTVSGCIYWGH